MRCIGDMTNAGLSPIPQNPKNLNPDLINCDKKVMLKEVQSLRQFGKWYSSCKENYQDGWYVNNFDMPEKILVNYRLKKNQLKKKFHWMNLSVKEKNVYMENGCKSGNDQCVSDFGNVRLKDMEFYDPMDCSDENEMKMSKNKTSRETTKRKNTKSTMRQMTCLGVKGYYDKDNHYDIYRIDEEFNEEDVEKISLEKVFTDCHDNL